MRILILGAGSWGTALALVVARAGCTVELWTRSAEHADEINRRRANPRYLAAYTLPNSITATSDLNHTGREAELIIFALPSHATREVARLFAASTSQRMTVVSATKGIEVESGRRISEIISEELPPERVAGLVAVSGPSFAEEVAADQPTAIVAAGADGAACQMVQRVFSYGNLRVYTNDDLAGTELAGAAKNTMALAAGMCAGLGLGTNSRAALITRGLAEITRLACAYGGRAETLTGLAGLGDLVLTCTGALSRNRHVGEQLGRGRPLAIVLSEMRETAEGVRTTAAIRSLAARRNIEMPITEEVYRVLYDGKPVAKAIAELMARPLRDEFSAVR